MNIIFLYTSPVRPNAGGVSSITYKLSLYFQSINNRVFFLSTGDRDSNTLYEPNQLFLGDAGENISKYDAFENILKSKDIDIIINQSSFSRQNLNLITKYRKNNPKCIVVSVLHMNLLAKINNLHYIYENKLNRLLVRLIKSRFVVSFLKRYYILKKRKYFIRLLNASDKIVVLSDKLIGEFFEMIGFYSPKVISIPNCCDYDLSLSKHLKKENRILWVGRIDEGKRLDVLLRVWHNLQNDFSNWHLDILGDGPSKDFCEKLSLKLGLRNIYFHGNIKNPQKFYERAKILSFTSGNEGFGLVLIESAYYSCARVLFDAFPAARDIVTNEKNGFLVTAFDLCAYENSMRRLMSNPKLIETIGECARADVAKFAVTKIGGKWIDMLLKLISNNI